MGSSNEDLLERVLYAYQVKNMYIQTLEWLIDWLTIWTTFNFDPISESPRVFPAFFAVGIGAT